MLSVLRALPFAGLVWFTGHAPARAQTTIAAPPASRPIANVAHIANAESPAIEADLSDTAWAKATFIELKQRLPNPGAPPTERTVVRAMYDENKMVAGAFALPSIPLLKKDYIDKGTVKLVFREYPLDGAARMASAVARCLSGDQYFSFIDLLATMSKSCSIPA